METIGTHTDNTNDDPGVAAIPEIPVNTEEQERQRRLRIRLLAEHEAILRSVGVVGTSLVTVDI